MLTINEVRCCGMNNPIGLDGNRINFSWKLASDKNNTIQNSYHIVVRDERDDIQVWDSGEQLSSRVSAIAYNGAELMSNRYYSYEISVTDNYGERAKSKGHCFSLGIKEHEWKANWIGCQPEELDDSIKMVTKEEMCNDFKCMVAGKPLSANAARKLEPCRVYRREFTVSEEVSEAFLSITAHGLYDAKINGRRITDTRLNPGFTAYEDYLEYQTYEVAPLIKKGSNVLTVVLADGWYRGTFGILGYGNNYDLELALLAQLQMRDVRGNTSYVLTNEDFSYCNTNVVYSDLMIGEKQDNRIPVDYLYESGCDMSGMKKAAQKDFGFANLHGIICEPVRCTQVISNPLIITSPKNETIVDMGQNMVGGIRLKAAGPEGTEIKMEFL